jgi:hypothetical protein
MFEGHPIAATVLAIGLAAALLAMLASVGLLLNEAGFSSALRLIAGGLAVLVLVMMLGLRFANHLLMRMHHKQ